MRTRRRPKPPPADANELLAALRASRLLSPEKIRRLAIDWSESRPDEPSDPLEGTRLRAQELVGAGLLTAWQVEQILSGQARRLRLGHYRLLEWLGAGGMGSVYKAEHRLMKRVVALKVLGEGARGGSGWELAPKSPAPSVARSRREVEAAARLAHPNIVAAYDAVRARGVLFLVMEYVEGIDLGRLVMQAGPLPVPLACEAIRQTALALQYAHERGLVHCDVKPSNLLLVHPPPPSWNSRALIDLADGRRPTLVKLLDMGLARRIDGPDGSAEEDLEGTPDYMAPERGSGEPIDGRSDLYSLGCTFYHLLTGRPPFPGGDWAGKLLHHRLDAPAPIRALRPDLPADVAAVVGRLMARDPADRYPKAALAAAALEACRAGAVPTAEGGASEKPPAELRPSPFAERTAHSGLPRRFRMGRALTAVLAGVLLGTAARCAIPAGDAPAAPAASVLPFVVEGRPGGFASLAEAVAAADDGGVVTIHGAGPYPTPPLSWHGRSLTLRAAAGDRPCLETRATAADPWQALLSADRDLTLEGLDLRSLPGDAGGGTTGRLICCERAALRLTDCNLSAPCGAGIVHRNGDVLSLQACRVESGGAAVSVEVGAQKTCSVRVMNTLLDVRQPAGTALALWAPEIRRPTTVEVELTADTFRADRATALTALPAGLHVAARGNEFFFRDGLLSCAGYADGQAWRRGTTWEGRDNRYHSSGVWLILDGAAAGVNDLPAWRSLWRDDEAGSRGDADGIALTPDRPGLLQGIVTRVAAPSALDRSAAAHRNRDWSSDKR